MKSFECRIDSTPRNTAVLKHLNATGQIAFDHYHEAEGSFRLVLTEHEISVLKHHGVKVERLIDLEEASREGRRRRVRKKGGSDDSDDTLSTGFVDQYLDAAEVAARIQTLAAEFPALCQLSALPNLTSGYDGVDPSLTGPASVQLLRITNTPAIHNKPGLLLICGTHSDEWINPLIAIEFAEQLLRNFDPASGDNDVININRIIQEGDVFIVPVMNPDGLNFSRHDSAGWRKNRRPNAGSPGCPGVDNNRNYEVYFGEPGSSSSACASTYHGASAFSEVENQNIRHILEHFPNILIGVDSHSSGEAIYRPQPTGGAEIASEPVFPADDAIYVELENAAVAAIQAVSGTTYSTGSTSNHAGTSDEYMYFAHGVFCFDFECALMHQPPIASALISVQEVTAALRVLALKVVDLDVAATMPAAIVQCIDRTGSMITFGYEAGARANARRFVDLMSINDRVAVVSFADPSADPAATPLADRAIVEFPLTDINDAGDFAAARASIDGIVFGGWTSIGAGLSKSADQLSGAASPRAVVLLSDGFENREPWAASVLATFPSDIQVYTVAMGSVADVPMLQNIATSTGGQFYISPTALELHEVYNQIRADVSDDDLVLNQIVTSQDDSGSFYQPYVERGAQKLTVSLSWEDKNRKPALNICDPTGRVVSMKDWGVKKVRGADYLLIQILRPMPGRWTITARDVPQKHVIAAFVRSPVQIKLAPWRDRISRQSIDSVLVRASIPGRCISRLAGVATLRQAPLIDKKAFSRKRGSSFEWTDGIPAEVRFNRQQEREEAGLDRAPIQPLQPFEEKRYRKLLSSERTAPGGLYQVRFRDLHPAGVYTVRLKIEGWLSERSRFERVALTTLGRETNTRFS